MNFKNLKGTAIFEDANRTHEVAVYIHNVEYVKNEKTFKLIPVDGELFSIEFITKNEIDEIRKAQNQYDIEQTVKAASDEQNEFDNFLKFLKSLHDRIEKLENKDKFDSEEFAKKLTEAFKTKGFKVYF